ncbi:MAG: hypothetical protein ACFBSD_04960 [Paracoccaceae bacterium]
MLLVITFLAFGALGWVRATRAEGNTADKVQYALAHAIPATLGMLALQIIAVNLGVLD